MVNCAKLCLLSIHTDSAYHILYINAYPDDFPSQSLHRDLPIAIGKGTFIYSIHSRFPCYSVLRLSEKYRVCSVVEIWYDKLPRLSTGRRVFTLYSTCINIRTTVQ